MSDIVIDELIVPDSLNGSGGDEFRELIEMRNEIEIATLGTDALAVTPEAIFPHFTSNPQRLRRHFVVRDGGRMVARGLLSWLTAEDAPGAWITVEVRESHRRLGIGSALFTHLEGLAADLKRRVNQVSVAHLPTPGGERIASPTGYGDLPASDPGVQFLLKRGYKLEMVARISTLDLTPAAIESLGVYGRAAQKRAGPDYRVVTWVGSTPEEWLASKAVLMTAMSVEEPSAGLETIEDVWDADRVREHDERQDGSGRTVFTAAAEHIPSGTLAAYTELGRLDGPNQPAVQEDTIVLPAHRGNRLGMLLKAANAQLMLKHEPDTAVITTFNAEDNEPMLRVNIDLGFRPIGAEGEWQKRV